MKFKKGMKVTAKCLFTYSDKKVWTIYRIYFAGRDNSLQQNSYDLTAYSDRVSGLSITVHAVESQLRKARN